MWRRVHRLFGFVVVPALSLLTPLLVIPLVARHGGGDAVVAVAIGQSIGFVGSLVIALAWPMTGPSLIARLADHERVPVYLDSIASRCLVFVLVAPGSALVAWSLTDAYVETAVLSAVALTANGFTAAWYYVGLGRPRGLLLYEALVRAGSAGLAAGALALDAPIVLYPVLLLGGAVASFALNYRHIVGRVRRPRFGRSALATVRAQLGSTLARLVNGGYQAGAVSIVAAVAVGPVLAFSAYDRTQKSLLLATQSATDAIISWVASPASGLRRRQHLALGADVAFVLVLGLVFYAGLPLILQYMYAGLVTVGGLDRALAAAGLAAAVLAKGVLSHALLPSGQERVASALLAVTSVMGVGLIAAGAAAFGVGGALGAVVITECAFVVAGLTAWTSGQHRVEPLDRPVEHVA